MSKNSIVSSFNRYKLDFPRSKKILGNWRSRLRSLFSGFVVDFEAPKLFGAVHVLHCRKKPLMTLQYNRRGEVTLKARIQLQKRFRACALFWWKDVWRENLNRIRYPKAKRYKWSTWNMERRSLRVFLESEEKIPRFSRKISVSLPNYLCKVADTEYWQFSAI